LKKGQTLTGQVIRLDFPNRGIIAADEGQCLVKNVIPGQKITFTINKTRKSIPEARLISIDSPSPLEIPSPCPHFTHCGGCIMQNLPYHEQLKIKEAQLYRLLGFKDEFEGIVGSPKPSAYRNKMEFSFGDEYKDGPLALGMHRRESFYDVVTVDNCQIVDEDYRSILKFTRDYFAQGFSHYHRIRHTGYLRHLLVRKAHATGEILIALITTSQESYDLTEWVNGISALSLTGTVNGILHIINDTVADIVRADQMTILMGQDFIHEELLGLRFKITPFSFFQTNSEGAEVLYNKAKDFISEMPSAFEKKPVIYDLYCGTGTITQLIAPIAAKVIGVDIVSEAICAARENAVLNGLHNCEFIAGDVLKVLDEISEKPDFIILDPPRDGIHPKALKKILAYEIPGLLYISCKPTSLLRDLKEFTAAGYRINRAAAVDLFPATGNVETIVLLEREDIPHISK